MFVTRSKYSRWLDEERRSEHTDEAMQRATAYLFDELAQGRLSSVDREAFLRAFQARSVVPSMRLFAMAGAATRANPVSMFNCSARVIDSLEAIHDGFYVLMCGTGFGYSVEREHIDKLPALPWFWRQHAEDTVLVKDSRKGWARALLTLLKHLWQGRVPQWDCSRVRPEGARLVTTGGTASGPAPLVRLFERAVEICTSAPGRRLRPLEVHLLMCTVAQTVHVGGVRRSAMIALFDADNQEMARCKTTCNEPRYARVRTALSNYRALVDNRAQFHGNHEYDAALLTRRDLLQSALDAWSAAGEAKPIGDAAVPRSCSLQQLQQQHSVALAVAEEFLATMQVPAQVHFSTVRRELYASNNSMVLNEKPASFEEFDARFWSVLSSSGSGEPGIFNRYARNATMQQHGREPDASLLTNPCAEINLRSGQFCNLSEVIVRPEDTEETLTERVRLATIVGTIVTTVRDMGPVLSDRCWSENTNEALLGVSLSGVLENRLTDVLTDPEACAAMLRRLRAVAERTNREYAALLGVPESKAICCIKPSGTTSLFASCAPGLHPPLARYSRRRVEVNAQERIGDFLAEQGVPWEYKISYDSSGRRQTPVPGETSRLFSFPLRASESARLDVSGEDQLKIALLYQENWCHHAVSCTVYVRDPEEWVRLGRLVYERIDRFAGMAFFPWYPDGAYEQAPFTPLTEAEYHQFVQAFPRHIDWDRLPDYENGLNQTKAHAVLACSVSGGGCSDVDVV